MSPTDLHYSSLSSSFLLFLTKIILILLPSPSHSRPNTLSRCNRGSNASTTPSKHNGICAGVDATWAHLRKNNFLLLFFSSCSRVEQWREKQPQKPTTKNKSQIRQKCWFFMVKWQRRARPWVERRSSLKTFFSSIFPNVADEKSNLIFFFASFSTEKIRSSYRTKTETLHM